MCTWSVHRRMCPLCMTCTKKNTPNIVRICSEGSDRIFRPSKPFRIHTMVNKYSFLCESLKISGIDRFWMMQQWTNFHCKWNCQEKITILTYPPLLFQFSLEHWKIRNWMLMLKSQITQHTNWHWHQDLKWTYAQLKIWFTSAQHEMCCSRPCNKTIYIYASRLWTTFQFVWTVKINRLQFIRVHSRWTYQSIRIKSTFLHFQHFAAWMRLIESLQCLPFNIHQYWTWCVFVWVLVRKYWAHGQSIKWKICDSQKCKIHLHWVPTVPQYTFNVNCKRK